MIKCTITNPVLFILYRHPSRIPIQNPPLPPKKLSVSPLNSRPRNSPAVQRIERRPPLETEIGGLGSVGSVVSWSKVKKKENRGNFCDSESQKFLAPAREAIRLRVMWPGSLSFPFFLLYSCLQSITRFQTPLSPVPGWPAAVQFGTADVIPIRSHAHSNTRYIPTSSVSRFADMRMSSPSLVK